LKRKEGVAYVKAENRVILAYAMLLVLLLLMVKLMTGVIVHETLGIGLALLATAHLLNNKSLIKSLRERRTRLALNVLLLASLLSTAVSGVMLSVVMFRFLNIPYHEIFYTVHTLSAYALLVLSLIHLTLHMKSIAAFFRTQKQARFQSREALRKMSDGCREENQ
jgi:hypothetical protein